MEISPERARILIIRLSAIGDVLHATHVARNLKRHFPESHVTWLASPPASELLKNNEDIDRLLVWDRTPLDNAFSGKDLRRVYHCLRDAYHCMAPYTFDIALDIQGLFLTGLLARLSGAKRRIGIHERHEGNSLFMTEMSPDTESPHKVLRYMTALKPLGVRDFIPDARLVIPSGLRQFARDFWSGQGISTNLPILLVNVRTTWPDKNWDPKFFGTALRALPPHVQIVFCGAKKDIPFIEDAMSCTKGAISIAGKTGLLELAALFESATLLLTCDTGPLYIAEAVGLPTLSLWGPTHPSIYGPLSPGHHFILSPHHCTACGKTKCRHHTNACMNAIPPETVSLKLLELLRLPPPQPLP